jgi:ubiquinone biosynthesis monooxygenase Coq7
MKCIVHIGSVVYIMRYGLEQPQMKFDRHYTLADKLCLGLDQAVRSLTNTVKTTGAPYPGNAVSDMALSPRQRKHAAALMRINHTGEICAQALYHGQGAVSRSQDVQEKMRLAAAEEGDHLAWCKRRLDELGGRSSYLDPFWYAGSFCMGMVAGTIGDTWSLGFVAETEGQVVGHLKAHLQALPEQDRRSYQILHQMEIDEARHQDEAIALGARPLPHRIKRAMAFLSKIMVKTAYWI